MDTYSTQAVSADTTLNATPVKRWKRGDVREDGMVFWARQGSSERWLLPDVFKAWHASDKVSRMARYEKNKDIELSKARERYAKDPQKKLKTNKKWAEDNAPRMRQLQRKWRANNVEKERKRVRESESKRIASDPVYALQRRVRGRIRESLKEKGFGKSKKTQEILGCSAEEFKAHIENQLLPGMTFKNKGRWHLDHITPIKLARTEAEVYALNHYTNFRPMWGKENQSKNAKLPAEHELPADLHDEVRKIWQRAKYSACVA